MVHFISSGSVTPNSCPIKAPLHVGLTYGPSRARNGARRYVHGVRWHEALTAIPTRL
jgi:hypothetical protein